MSEQSPDRSPAAFPDPARPSTDGGVHRRSATRFAVTAIALLALGATALTTALTGLDDDSKQRITICDAGATTAPAASWHLTALAAFGPLLFLLVLGRVVRAYRRGPDRRTMTIIGLVIATTIVVLPVGLLVAVGAVADRPGYACPYSG